MEARQQISGSGKKEIVSADTYMKNKKVVKIHQNILVFKKC